MDLKCTGSTNRDIRENGVEHTTVSGYDLFQLSIVFYSGFRCSSNNFAAINYDSVIEGVRERQRNCTKRFDPRANNLEPANDIIVQKEPSGIQ